MSDGLLPPYGLPSGPPVEDAEVLRAYARGEQAGHSSQFHVEGDALMMSWEFAAALRVGPGTVLVRLDLDDHMSPARELIEQALAAEGMTRLDTDTLLATPVAVQVLGLRTSKFDLWGTDLDEGFADLRAAAAGESRVGEPGSGWGG